MFLSVCLSEHAHGKEHQVHVHTDRQTDRQKDRQTDRQTDRQALYIS